MYGEYDPEVLEKLHKAELIILNDFKAICEAYNIKYFVISGTAIGAVRHQGFIPWDDDIDIAMLRKEYRKFVKAANIEFAGEKAARLDLAGKYEMMGPEFERKYYNMQPAMNRKNTVFVNDNAWAGGYEPGLFLDLFVYENIPEDEKKAAQIIKKTRLCEILYIIYNVNFLKLIPNKSLKEKMRMIIYGIIRAVLKLIPHCDKRIFKCYIKQAKRYYGKTDRYTALVDPGASIMDIHSEDILPLVDMPFENTTVKMLKNYEKQLKKHMGNYMEIPPVDKRTNHCPRKLDFGDMEV